MAATVAVVLSGCGYLDGAEVQESVLSLYFLDRAGAKVRCFAPETEQMHVVDHVSQSPQEGQRRQVRIESARITRSEPEPLSTLQVQDFDALVIPGGYGVAKNLSDFAVQGEKGQVQPEFARVLQDALSATMPIAAICIAPAVLAMVLHGMGKSATLTVGEDPQVARAITQLGCSHQVSQAQEIVVDAQAKIISTPAYMIGQSPAEVGAGIESAISKLMTWVG